MDSSKLMIEVDAKCEELIEVKMISNNKIDGLLSMRCFYEDNKLYYLYDTKKYVSLAEMDKKDGVEIKLLYRVYDVIASTITGCASFLINEELFVLASEYIFINPNNYDVRLCVVPGNVHELQSELKSLTEYLMRQTNHADKMAVKFIYEVYELITMDVFDVSSISLYLVEFDKERQKDSTISQIAAVSADKHKLIYERKAHHRVHCDENSKGKTENTGTLAHIQYGLSLCVKLSAGVLDEIMWLNTASGYDTENSRVYVVGRKGECDIKLLYNQISRRHAMIEIDINGIYITDTDSMNGTYVNGQKISAHVKTKCRCNDVITFADIDYRIIKRTVKSNVSRS